MAGATGCSFISSANVTGGNDLIEQPVVGQEEDAAGITEFSDALTVMRADITRELRVDSHDTAAASFVIKGTHTLEDGDPLVATDCNHVAVFEMTGGETPNVNHGVNLGEAGAVKAYDEDSRLYPLQVATYYVEPNPADVPSLYRVRADGTEEELVEGVEDLQLTYGVDTNVGAGDGQADGYRTATQVNAGAWGANAQERWARVLSVKVSLLMRTVENNVIPTAQGYTYNGVEVDADDVPDEDRYLRKVFTHVIKLRNR
jgi:type IV pilus assembly protein PilW